MTDGPDRHAPPTADRRPTDPSYDAVTPIETTTSLCIASEPRTGSTLLAQALWATGRAGMPAEYLLAPTVEEFRQAWGVPVPTVRGRVGRWRRRRAGGVDLYLRFSQRSMRAFLTRLAATRSSENGVFAIKLMWEHDHRLRSHRLAPDDFPGRTVWVRLRRHDIVRQAVSWTRSLQTGRFHSFQPEDAPTHYDRAQIDRSVAAVRRTRRHWESYFDDGGPEALDIWYEDLVADYGAALDAVFSHAGIATPPAWPEPPLARMSDEITEEWVQRYESGR